jgi:PAS domain S-box-containing protein
MRIKVHDASSASNIPAPRAEMAEVQSTFSAGSFASVRDQNQARLWLDAIVDAADDAIIGRDLAGIITSWNRAAEVMFGYPAHEILGQPISAIVPTDRGGEESLILARIVRNEQIQHYETWRQCKNGAVIPVSVSVLPVRDQDGGLIGIFKIAHDRAQRDTRERLLETTNARSVETIGQLETAETSARLALDAARLGLMNIYPQTKMIVLDARAGSMFGLSSAASLTDDAFLCALHPESRASWLATRDANYERSEFVQEFRVVSAEGGGERVLTASGRCYPEGAVCRIVRCVVRDVTEISSRRVEEHLRLRHDAAMQASLAKARFLAAASHDLRQPLHAITMFLAVLRSDPPPARTRVILDNITSAIASMQRMFQGLLDIVRLEAGMMTPRPDTVSLQTAFNAIHTMFESSAQTKGLRLRVQPTTAVLTTDPAMLQSVLQNLVSNAISYTTHGEVALEARETPNGIAIEVLDTGCGIPPDRLADVFGEFVRLNCGGGSQNGIGLGLAIVRRQVTDMGAAIHVRSELGVGSVFTLTVPRGSG